MVKTNKSSFSIYLLLPLVLGLAGYVYVKYKHYEKYFDIVDEDCRRIDSLRVLSNLKDKLNGFKKDFSEEDLMSLKGAYSRKDEQLAKTIPCVKEKISKLEKFSKESRWLNKESKIEIKFLQSFLDYSKKSNYSHNEVIGY